MSISKIIYGVLVLAAIIALFMPWTVMDGKGYSGLTFIFLPSLGFFIGIVLSIVILFTGYKSIGLSIVAGLLMLLSVGVSLVILGASIALSNSGRTSGLNTFGNGYALAIIISILFPIIAPIAGSRFKKQL